MLAKSCSFAIMPFTSIPCSPSVCMYVCNVCMHICICTNQHCDAHKPHFLEVPCSPSTCIHIFMHVCAHNAHFCVYKSHCIHIIHTYYVCVCVLFLLTNRKIRREKFHRYCVCVCIYKSFIKHTVALHIPAVFNTFEVCACAAAATPTTSSSSSS
jgi:hypothetical protein